MDYSRSGAADLKRLADRLQFLSEGERETLRSLISSDVEAAGKLATKLKARHDLRQAGDAFGKFRNAVVVNALYYDEEVEAALSAALKALARISVLADEILDDESVSYKDRGPALDELESATGVVRMLMAREIRAGFVPARTP